VTHVISGLPRPESLPEVPAGALYVIPRGLVCGPSAEPLVAAGHAIAFTGARAAFTAVEIAVRRDGAVERYAASVTAFDPWRRIIAGPSRTHIEDALHRISSQRGPFAGVAMDKSRIMGIVNVTPDSFSDGGDHATTEAAIAHALNLAREGAEILDVGGESTRPGASPVAPEIEISRVVPVVRALAEKGLTVSIDTRNAETMSAALDAGASIVNDVTALTGDAAALDVVTNRRCPVVLMHMQGEPQTMQVHPTYTWAPADIFDYLEKRVAVCRDAGMDLVDICVDPGIGFGKTVEQNIDLIAHLSLFAGLGCPLMLGASRKNFIGKIAGIADPKERKSGSIAAALLAAGQGTQILRVHDVAETRQALDIQAQAAGA